MGRRYPPPDNEYAFQSFCLRFFRFHLHRAGLLPFGKRGESQDGIDILDTSARRPSPGTSIRLAPRIDAARRWSGDGRGDPARRGTMPTSLAEADSGEDRRSGPSTVVMTALRRQSLVALGHPLRLVSWWPGRIAGRRPRERPSNALPSAG